MYLHLGQSVVVPFRDVVGIFDLDNTTSSIHTRKFLERAEKEGRVVDVSGDLPKSFTVCRTGKGPPTVYLSQLSSATLLNALKRLAGIGHEHHLISREAIEPIQTVKVKYLGSNNPRLHSDEVLIALAASANLDPKAQAALHSLAALNGCQAHCSVILSPPDESTYKKLGLQLTCEPQYQTNNLYHR